MAPVATFLAFLLTVVGFITFVFSAPTGFDLYGSGSSSSYQDCSDVHCRSGTATVDLKYNTCVCPQWLGEEDPIQKWVDCSSLSCPDGFQAVSHLFEYKCSCQTICDFFECDGVETSIFSEVTGGCACVLDCGALIECSDYARPEFDEETHLCYCQEKDESELMSWSEWHGSLQKRLEERQEASLTTTAGALTVAAPSFTGTPTSFPQGINTSAPAVVTFIPPPSTDITPALIQEAMNEQPQSTAMIVAATPYFLAGVISYCVQLQGLVANIITMNASTTIPCGTIGNNIEPGLVVVPQTIKNGTTQVTLQSCLVIAVNIYNSSWITYWVQRPDGQLFSVLSDNRIHDLDKIDTGVTAFADILTTDLISKRGFDLPSIKITMPVEMEKRGLQQVDDYTTGMSAKSCALMTCKNNGGKPALHNPFQQTCYCQDKEYAAVNPSGDDKVGSK